MLPLGNLFNCCCWKLIECNSTFLGKSGQVFHEFADSFMCFLSLLAKSAPNGLFTDNVHLSKQYIAPFAYASRSVNKELETLAPFIPTILPCYPTIKHRANKRHVNTDVLSRAPVGQGDCWESAILSGSELSRPFFASMQLASELSGIDISL